MMHVTYPIKAKDIALLQLEYNTDYDLTVESSEIAEGDFIGNDNNVKLTFLGADADQSIITFEQYKSSSNTTETFKFSLNWWAS